MSVDADVALRELNDPRALRIVGICFLLLAVYITYESGADLIFKRAPKHSLPGIILACVSLVVMPALSKAKRKVGSELNSVAMQADAKQTDFCVYLSAILVGGLAESTLQLLVGRPCGSAFDGAAHRKRRNRSPAL